MPIEIIQNPWNELPIRSPYVLPCDKDVIETLNNNQKNSNKIFDLTLHPEPFFGSINAPVYLLALNPGWSPGDAEIHSNKNFSKLLRESLINQGYDNPHIYLRSDIFCPGAKWWKRICASIIKDVGLAYAAKSIFCVEYFPYHSREYSFTKLLIPSQGYSFQLVRLAIQQNKTIICMRSWKFWTQAVPELLNYNKVIHVKNPRNPTLSRKNLDSGYDEIITLLKPVPNQALHQSP